MRLIINVVFVFNVFMTISIQGEIPMEMMEMMDTGIDPCDDFYKYSCGGWLRKNRLKPRDVRLHASISTVQANNDRLFDLILSQKPPILVDFWKSCMNAEKIKMDNKILQTDLARIAKAKTKEDILELAGEFSRTGTNAFIKFEVNPDVEDNTINALYVEPLDMTLPNYSPAALEKISVDYHRYITDLMTLSGFSNFQQDQADSIISIEETLVSIVPYYAATKSDMSIAEALTNWPTIFGAFSKGVALFEKYSINKDIKIYIQGSRYLDYLEQSFAKTSLDVFKVYLSFVMIHSRVQWLGQDYYQIWFKLFGQKLKGQLQADTRNMICKKNLLEYVPDLIGKYYYQEAFDSEREKDVMQMMTSIQEAMGNHIVNSEWVTPNDKEAAKTKLSKVIPLIGRPSRPKSYPSILYRNDYPTNVYNILSHSFDIKMKKVGQRVDRAEWDISSADVKAYYEPLHNSIVFPAAILQPPFYNGHTVHPARNFGAIGTVMGHELTHGFDSVGHLYDGDGNFDDWWSTFTRHQFDNHAKCFDHQYSTFKVDGEEGTEIGTVRGDLTLDENIADNGGLSLAWDAYQQYMTSIQSHKNAVKTHEGNVMFFLTYGQTYCEHTRDTRMLQKLARDPHAPSQWRVNGAVMNNKHFAQVFQCKPGTLMNPVKKCKVW